MSNRRVDKAELVRIGIRLSKDVVEEFNEAAGELGMRRSHLISMCAVLGLRQIERAVHPEKAFPPEVWQSLIKASAVDTQEVVKDLVR